jgi:tRNA G18 (ribose-2'-O)-methylase SpoU
MKPQHGEVASFCRTLARARKPYRQVEPAELARIADTVLNGGIVAIARPRPLHDFDLEAAPEIAEAWARDGQPLLILDGIGNPLNLGVIVRSAAYFGIERILLADRPEQALPSDASYRVAEGGFEHLSLYRFAVRTRSKDCGGFTGSSERLSTNARCRRHGIAGARSRSSSATRRPASIPPRLRPAMTW